LTELPEPQDFLFTLQFIVSTVTGELSFFLTDDSLASLFGLADLILKV